MIYVCDTRGIKMITCLFVEIHLVCIVLFAYVYLVSRRQSVSKRFARAIGLFIGVAIVSSVLEIIASLLKISRFGCYEIVLNLGLVVCFTFIVQLGYLWMRLVLVLLHSKLILNRCFLVMSYIPTAAVMLLICTSPNTNLIFYHTEHMELCLGPLFFILFALKYGYYLFVTILALLDSKQTTDRVVKRRCCVIIKCMLFPMIFDSLLPFCDGMYISNIGTALSCSYIAFNLYSHVLEQSPVWKKMMDAVGCGFININMNTNQIVSYNQYATEILGLQQIKEGQEFYVNEYLLKHQAEDDNATIISAFEKLKTEAGKISFFTKIRHEDGIIVPVSISINHIEDITGEKLYVYSLQDETKVREAMQKSVFTQNILSAIGNIYFCIYYIDIKNDLFLEVTSLSFLSAYLGKEGKASETFKKWRDSAVLSDYIEDLAEFQQLDTLRERIGSASAISIDFQTKLIGWCRGLFIPVKRDENGMTTHVLWAARNINEDMLRLEQNRKYLDLYNHDALTGLYNRYGFNECIETMLHNNPAGGIALLMLDLDLFKKVNDTYGHQNGDIVLRNVAEKLRSCVGKDGEICRWGGEEFMVLLSDDQNAIDLAEKLRSGIENMGIEISDATIHITVSIGVCIVNKGISVTADRMVYSADKCLYAAKRAGRNLVMMEIIEC